MPKPSMPLRNVSRNKMVPYQKDPSDAWIYVWHHPSHHYPLFLVYRLSVYKLIKCVTGKKNIIIPYHIISYYYIIIIYLVYKSLLWMLCNHGSKECPKGMKAFAKAFAINFQYFVDGFGSVVIHCCLRIF